MFIQPTYLVSDKINEKYLTDNFNFRKSEYGLTLRFPVYKYKSKPLIFSEFVYDKEESQIHIRAIDINGYSCNYNKEIYGKSDVIIYINKQIWSKLNELIKGGVIC